AFLLTSFLVLPLFLGIHHFHQFQPQLPAHGTVPTVAIRAFRHDGYYLNGVLTYCFGSLHYGKFVTPHTRYQILVSIRCTLTYGQYRFCFGITCFGYALSLCTGIQFGRFGLGCSTQFGSIAFGLYLQAQAGSITFCFLYSSICGALCYLYALLRFYYFLLHIGNSSFFFHTLALLLGLALCLVSLLLFFSDLTVGQRFHQSLWRHYV